MPVFSVVYLYILNILVNTRCKQGLSDMSSPPASKCVIREGMLLQEGEVNLFKAFWGTFIKK